MTGPHKMSSEVETRYQCCTAIRIIRRLPFPRCYRWLQSISVTTGGGGKWRQFPNRQQTRSWDLRKSDAKHAGRNLGQGVRRLFAGSGFHSTIYNMGIIYTFLGRAVMNYGTDSWSLVLLVAHCRLYEHVAVTMVTFANESLPAAGSYS